MRISPETGFEVAFHYKKKPLSVLFRGMLPVVVDIETSGLNPMTHCILEIAAVTLKLDDHKRFSTDEVFSYQVEPFKDALIDQNSLEITGIDPSHPLRFPIPEQQAIHNLFTKIKICLEKHRCQRAILVGHNAWFDLAFLHAAINRCQYKYNPFHTFTTIDTASLSAVILGETVLARAAKAVNIHFDVNEAHSAVYDAQKTAELFCCLVNEIKRKA